MSRGFRLFLALGACALGAVVLASNSFAWKPISHVYFSEVAVEDALDDGKVTIYLLDPVKQEILKDDNGNLRVLGEYEVRDDFLRILANNRAVYRAGVFGPDAYPDILTGQQAVHPDEKKEGGPYTDQWFQYLYDMAFVVGTPADKTDANKAFVLGFLTHGAGDMYAHTFVNHYAGGNFKIGDNAIRHLVIEGYLGKRTPGPSYYDVALPESVQKFIHRNLIDAYRNDYLDRRLLKGPGVKYSIPRQMADLLDYLDTFDRDYAIKWLKKEYFPNTPDFLIAITVDNIVLPYIEAWRQDIDEGLKMLPWYSHEIAKGAMLKGGQRPDDPGKPYSMEYAEKMANEYATKHLMSMAGLPDVAGGLVGYLQNLAPQFILDVIADYRRGLLNYAFIHMTGRPWELAPGDPVPADGIRDTKSIIKDPDKYFDLVMERGPAPDNPRPKPVTLGELNQTYLKLRDTAYANPGERFDWKVFAPAYNTVTLNKLLFVKKSEINRLLRDLKEVLVGDLPVYTLDAANITLGFNHTLDGDNQWNRNDDKMVLARKPFYYYRIFRWQQGDRQPEPKDQDLAGLRKNAPPEETAPEESPDDAQDAAADAGGDADSGMDSSDGTGGPDTDASADGSAPVEKDMTDEIPPAEDSGDGTTDAGDGGPAAQGGGEQPAPPRPDEAAPAAAVTPLRVVADATVCLDETKRASFRDQVIDVQISSANAAIASASLVADYTVGIKGESLGETSVTVKGKVVSYQAGINVPLRRDRPFTQTVKVFVKDCDLDEYDYLYGIIKQMQRRLRDTEQRYTSEIVGKMEDPWKEELIPAEKVLYELKRQKTQVKKSIDDLDELKDKWEDNKVATGQLVRMARLYAPRAIAAAWKISIDEAAKRVAMLRKDMHKKMKDLRERHTAEDRELKDRTTSYADPGFIAESAAITARYVGEEMPLLEGILADHRAITTDLAAQRRELAGLVWQINEFYRLNGEAEQMKNVQKFLYKQFAYNLRGRDAEFLKLLYGTTSNLNSELDYFVLFAGSPDRLILNRHLTDGEKVYKMDDVLREQPVESLR